MGVPKKNALISNYAKYFIRINAFILFSYKSKSKLFSHMQRKLAFLQLLKGKYSFYESLSRMPVTTQHSSKHTECASHRKPQGSISILTSYSEGT